MKNPLFARIELWAVVLVVLFGVLAAIFFGNAALNAERGGDRYGAIGEMALVVAEIPDTVKKLTEEDMAMAAFLPRRFADRPAGWTFTPDVPHPPGYLLLSFYDGDRMRHVVQLVDLADGSVKHEWLPDADALLKDVPRPESEIAEYTLWNRTNYRAIAPYLTPDGGLLIKDHQSYLFMLDACAKPIWSQTDVLFHHSTASDGAGGWWIPSYIEPPSQENLARDFAEDSLVHVGPDGKILSQKSVLDIFLDHGLGYLLFTAGNYQKDPMHLNDIEPVLQDGPYWKKGDLFLSFRHLSMLMLYRPSTGEIVWKQQGPWMAQHDVDILNDHQIGVFDNNAYDRGTGARVAGHNEVMVHDFAADTDSTPWSEALATADVKTLFEGEFSVLPGGELMVEEENSGRLLFFAPDHRLAAEFIDRGENGISYRMGWSRYMTKEEGEAVLPKLTASCG